MTDATVTELSPDSPSSSAEQIAAPASQLSAPAAPQNITQAPVDSTTTDTNSPATSIGGGTAAAPVSSETPSAKEDDPLKASEELSKPCAEGSLDMHIRDWHGDPIPNLAFKVLADKKEVFKGQSDAKGQIPIIKGLKIGSIFEIQVKKDTGEYKFAAIGKIEAEENYACLKSPKVRFEFSTEPHPGAAGNADKHKEKTIQSHNQKPTDKPQITGNPDKKPEVKHDRDDTGAPKASVIDGMSDWYGRHANNAGAPQTNATDLEHVNKVIEFGMKQAGWVYPDQPADVYIKKMIAKTFETPAETKKIDASIGRCTRYVKIALWKAGYGPTEEEIGFGVVPAKDMGAGLLKAGFKDITGQIPDGRWAAPGDVIVYKWSDSEWERRKKKKGANYPNLGHIDVRTYDGYLSDFLGTHLPDVSKFKVTGIYRKYSDPMPEKRMRAFLEVLREWECHEERDDSQRYYMLQQPINGSRRFADTRQHPFKEKGGMGTFAGAYQISLSTWNDAHDRGGIPFEFTPMIQDRIAVWKCEDRKALKFIRLGQIENAVNALLKEWTSLPGGKDARKGKVGDPKYVWTIADLLNIYEKNLSKL